MPMGLILLGTASYRYNCKDGGVWQMSVARGVGRKESVKVTDAVPTVPRTVQEILSGIRVVKYYIWLDDCFSEKNSRAQIGGDEMDQKGFRMRASCATLEVCDSHCSNEAVPVVTERRNRNYAGEITLQKVA